MNDGYLTAKEPLVGEDTLRHYGVGHLDGGKSGRYPWGSGEDHFQRIGSFSDRVKQMRKNGMTNQEIVEELGLFNENELRIIYRADNNLARAERVKKVKEMTANGMSTTQISKATGIPEGTVRSLLDEERNARALKAYNAAKQIEKAVDEHGMIDVGLGVETSLDMSKEKMTEAIAIMQRDGYQFVGASVGQVNNPGQRTVLSAIIPPGADPKEAQRMLYNDPDKLATLQDYTMREDAQGNDVLAPKWQYPASMDSDRLYIRYKDEAGPDGHTGVERDGIIELRRNVPDLDLQGSNYAQVRILVDNDRYLKGMAVYSDSIPDGYDVVFNTNKSSDKSMRDVLKKVDQKDIDAGNPFGSAIKEIGGQYEYYDEKGEKHLGLINKRSDEGDWGQWSHELPSQVLAKQPEQLVKKQLKLALDDKEADFNDILSIDNPTVKRHFLEEFASQCDADAVSLKAAALPRQQYQVILPLPSLKDNECYAPNYENGETVALIRFPHGGRFEIPILKVNNNNEEGNKVITKNAKDAIGINSKNAGILSGADFDGDTVLVIPCNSPKTSTRLQNLVPEPGSELAKLKDFDPKMSYPEKPGMKYMSKKSTQTEMGKVSNLIMDMTIKGATEDELARAVRHSMVVIDACKHKLNYKQSEVDNDIKGLRKKYQEKTDPVTGEKKYGGASTLLTLAGSQYDIPKRKGGPRPDPETGEVSYRLANETYRETKKIKDKNGNVIRDPNTGKPLTRLTGKIKTRTQKSTKMAETKDAFTLSTGTPIENAYAEFANRCKDLANRARKALFGEDKKLIRLKYNSDANKAYHDEVEELEHALRLAQMNAPRERKAQAATTSRMRAIEADNWDMTDEEKKKMSSRFLKQYRAKYNAQRAKIDISDKQWRAIQSGAISDTSLTKILRYADADQLRQRATPRPANGQISAIKQARIRSMKANNYTNAEIANALGISVSTVNKYGNE